MSLLLTVVVAVVLWSAIGTLRRRIGVLEASLASITILKNEVERLAARVRALEQGQQPAAVDDVTPGLDVNEGSADVAVSGTGAWWPSPSGSSAIPPSVESEPPVSVPTPAAAIVASTLNPDSTMESVTPTAPSAAPAPDSETWEVMVGTSWLNKIGVLVLVMGLALLLGYSMANIGPAGRVAVGLVMSAALAAAGVVLERRAESRNYGYGLIAGGWAGAYVTAFAMRAVPAARVLESDVSGLAVLLAVATGMVAHSLRYRSETVTTLAYVAAYVPLAFTPLTTYSLIASVPLVISLLFVAQRLGWSSIAALGLASTYGLFAMRGSVLPGEAPDATSLSPYLVLAVYWLAFEIADMVGLRATLSGTARRIPLFAMNAVGSLGAALMLADRGGEGAMVAVLIGASVAYLGGAAVRSRAVPVSGEAPGVSAAFTSTHASIALSAAMAAWAIDIRMTGPQQSFAFLLAAELLFVAGLSLRDRQIRNVAAAFAWLVTLHAISLIVTMDADDLTWPWTMAAWTPVVAVAAAVWYGNREWLRACGEDPGRLERDLPWTALLMIGAIIGHDLDVSWQGLAGLALALLLLELGSRLSREYRVQSYVALGVGAVSAIAAFAPASSAPSLAVTRGVMPLAIACAYAYAWRIRRVTSAIDPISRVAAGAAASAGTTLLTILEWRLLPAGAVGPAWSTTAMGLLYAGVHRSMVGLRWQSYALLAVAVTFTSQWSLAQVALAERSGTSVIAAPLIALGVFAAAYAGAFISRARREVSGDALQTTAQLERLALIALPFITTMYLVSFESVWLGTRHVSVAWTLTAFALLASGLLWRAVDLRVQAYGVFALATLITLFFIVVPPEDASVSSGAAAIAIFYACGIGCRQWMREAGVGATDSVRRVDAGARLALLAAGTVLLAVLVGREAAPSLVTMGWGLQGTALLLIGFVARERALRLAGLAMLFVCILKLFLYDLRELEALARILSFVVLGLVLLGVSWTYTRYKEQIRKLF